MRRCDTLGLTYNGRSTTEEQDDFAIGPPFAGFQVSHKTVGLSCALITRLVMPLNA